LRPAEYASAQPVRAAAGAGGAGEDVTSSRRPSASPATSASPRASTASRSRRKCLHRRILLPAASSRSGLGRPQL